MDDKFINITIRKRSGNDDKMFFLMIMIAQIVENRQYPSGHPGNYLQGGKFINKTQTHT